MDRGTNGWTSVEYDVEAIQTSFLHATEIIGQKSVNSFMVGFRQY